MRMTTSSPCPTLLRLIAGELRQYLECNSERTFRPHGKNKGILCFADDMHLAAARKSSDAVACCRQLVDHGGIYDGGRTWMEVSEKLF
jgi:hypothetical protein